MGWFGEPGSVEDFIAQADTDGGVKQKVARGSVTLEPGNEDGTLEINAGELEAWKASFSSTAPKEQ
jgi:protein import protein ZIM17